MIFAFRHRHTAVGVLIASLDDNRKPGWPSMTSQPVPMPKDH